MKTGIPGFQGFRLTQAREAMNLTQTSLADLLGVSRQAVSQYEKDSDSPGTEVFDRICSILRQEPQFFLRPRIGALSEGTRFYRSMASTTKGARKKAEVWEGWVRELICYLSEFIEIPPPNLPMLDLPSDPLKLSSDQIEAAATDLRAHWRLGDGPIANLTSVAEANGFWIFRHPMDAETLDALSEWILPEDVPLVILNADKNVAVRSRLDLAHEIGHMILHRYVKPETLNRAEMFRLIETQAFHFGAALLVPEKAFLSGLYSVSLDSLRAQKTRWKVSIAMMIEWLKNKDIIGPDQHRRLRINYSTRKWNRIEPLDAEIPVEQSTFVAKSIDLILRENLQSADQIVANTGFSKEWLQKLLGVSANALADRAGPSLKLIHFNKRA